MKYKANKVDKARLIVHILLSTTELPPPDHFKVKQLARLSLKELNPNWLLAKEALRKRNYGQFEGKDIY